MKLLRYLALFCTLAGSASAQLPHMYKSVNRVVWLVQNVDLAKQAWIPLGLSDIHEYPDVVLTGQEHGKPVKMWAWEITGHLGNLAVEMIQPAEGQLNAWNEFLGKHGDGIFSIMFEVHSQHEMTAEIQRMHSLGVGVLQQLSFARDGKQVTCTYFDTASRGKYVLGLLYTPGGAPSFPVSGPPGTVSHLGLVATDLSGVSAYWKKLGFPGFDVEHTTPRKDMTYRGQPLWFSFDVGFQRFSSLTLEWLAGPPTPANAYAEWLKLHGEGVQHIGVLVDDLNQSVAAFQKHGYQVWQTGAWGDVGQKDSGIYDYMDTNSIGGVSVELIHAYK